MHQSGLKELILLEIRALSRAKKTYPMWHSQIFFLALVNCREAPPRYAEEWTYWRADDPVPTETFRPSFISCSAVCNKLLDGCSVFQYNPDLGGRCKVGKHVTTNGLTDMLNLGMPHLLFVKRNPSAIESGMVPFLVKLQQKKRNPIILRLN